MMDDMSGHVPTVHDCYGCRHNTVGIHGEHCRGCRVYGDWLNRERPTKYEPEEISFTTNTVPEKTLDNGSAFC